MMRRREQGSTDMALVGRALLILGLLVALYGIGASLYGAVTGRREWVVSGRRARCTRWPG